MSLDSRRRSRSRTGSAYSPMLRMTERALPTFFVILAGAMLLSLAGTLTWRREAKRPDDAKALAAWLEAHPADALAASALTEVALDADVQTRFDLWHAAHKHAQSLAPLLPDARTA